MLILITGGAASGKSALAEGCCVRLGGPLLYVATMQPWDGECVARIEKHQHQRAGYGFDTLECYRGLDRLRLSGGYRTALLECMGNLTANEMFAVDGDEDASAVADCLVRGVLHLAEQVEHLVVISNEVFADATVHDPGTQAWLTALGGAVSRIADRADLVAEAVCGIPVIRKGGPLP